VPFYKELGNQGHQGDADSGGGRSRSARRSLRVSTPSRCSAIWRPGTILKSIKSPLNAAFIKDWHAFIKNDKRTTNDPMEAHFIGFKHVGEGGREGAVDQPRQGDRGAARHPGPPI